MFLQEGGHLKTQRHTGRSPCVYEDRNWNYVAISQGISKIAEKSPEARKRYGNIPQRFHMEHGPGNTLISDF